MNKPLDSLLKYLFLLDTPLDLSQTLNSFSLKGVKCSLKILTSSGMLQGSYTCQK
jgi:hypothetical protein